MVEDPKNRRIKKLTVITLTYNNWKLLDEAILSVKSQILNDFYTLEYLILDDGSADFSFDYVNNLLKGCLFDFKIIQNNCNLGTVKSLNKAIRLSTGDAIVVLSADDEFYDVNVLMDIVNTFESGNDLIITGLRVPFNKGMEHKTLPLPSDRKYFNNIKKLLKKIILKGNIISGASTCYHRDVFSVIGFFDEKYRLLEDYPFYIKALANNINIKLLSRKFIKYRLGGISTSDFVNPQLKLDMLKANEYAFNVGNLSVFDKRCFKYRRVLTSNERKMIKNLILYPEQVLLCFFERVFHV
jgi:glycosyltransferase involved in cell wall biosynthesis